MFSTAAPSPERSPWSRKEEVGANGTRVESLRTFLLFPGEGHQLSPEHLAASQLGLRTSVPFPWRPSESSTSHPNKWSLQEPGTPHPGTSAPASTDSKMHCLSKLLPPGRTALKVAPLFLPWPSDKCPGPRCGGSL